MTVLVPSFTWRPVDAHYQQAMRPIGLVLHVAQAAGSLYGAFSHPDSTTSSHLWAGMNGEREQYVSLDQPAWAQMAGNRLYASIETAGWSDQPLTAAQLETVAVAYATGMVIYGWPAQATDTPGAPGLILHSAGGAAWGNHACPGPIRAAQRPAILTRAQQIVQELTMPAEQITPDQERDIAAGSAAATLSLLWTQMQDAALQAQQPLRQATPGGALYATYRKAGRLEAGVSWLIDSVEAIAVHFGVPLPPRPPDWPPPTAATTSYPLTQE
ncbi:MULTISPECIES: peptidoglycan recognition protein family protein [Frankia]|uniref:peptidoglycan recognition protein family protein n=1 Tax=Frankia TaxID=1854 RepID=UPI0002D8476A|nr:MULTISPECIES: N-acetylmuramoyl-L-alanine amidase [Frankia]